MLKAAHRFYDNEDVFFDFLKSCPKDTLLRLMMTEQSGPNFDQCVKELYGKVKYQDIRGMTRDSARNEQYLDAVKTVEADTDVEDHNLNLNRREEPCTPREIQFLRLKCPSLRVITRHNAGGLGGRFTILFTPTKHTGTICLHEHYDLVPRGHAPTVLRPEITAPALWAGWPIKHTVGLAVENVMGSTGRWDETLKEMLLDTHWLDKRVTQIQTGWIRFDLTELTTIVTSRLPDKNPISRISAIVEPFDFASLRQFMMMSGNDLYQLHLNTMPHPSKITPHDLHLLAPTIRTQCPKLSDLRLPIDFSRNGISIMDKDLRLPPSELLYGTGTIRKLMILAYNVPFDSQQVAQMFSLNVARNLACILSPDFEIDWRQGPMNAPPDILLRGVGFPLFGAWVFEQLSHAIRFFQRLGHRLQPYFTNPSLAHLQITCLTDLDGLTYHTNGQPIPRVKVQPEPSRHFKRSWQDFMNDDEDDNEDEDEDDYNYPNDYSDNHDNDDGPDDYYGPDPNGDFDDDDYVEQRRLDDEEADQEFKEMEQTRLDQDEADFQESERERLRDEDQDFLDSERQRLEEEDETFRERDQEEAREFQEMEQERLDQDEADFLESERERFRDEEQDFLDSERQRLEEEDETFRELDQEADREFLELEQERRDQDEADFHESEREQLDEDDQDLREAKRQRLDGEEAGAGAKPS